MNEYYGVSPSSDFFAHYGVRGMKWGVRKAIYTRNQKALDRHFRKAARKLRKLQDIGLNSKKYAVKAAAYGAAAAGTGTIAVGGTELASKAAKAGAGWLLKKAKLRELQTWPGVTLPANHKFVNKSAQKLAEKSKWMSEKGQSIEDWGKQGRRVKNVLQENSDGSFYAKQVTGKIDNNSRVRIGAAAATAVLGAKAAQNVYRATHGTRYRQKAIEFKNAMDDAFKGTKYAGQYIVPSRKKKRRR